MPGNGVSGEGRWELGSTPLVIGHRGFPARHPDNSLAGVRTALSVGADGVEVDVRRCAGGQWICHHDRSRLGRPLSAWPQAALAAAGVPTLAQVAAELSQDHWLFVEVKPLARKDLESGLEELARSVMPRLARTRALSSSLRVLAVLGSAFPGLECSWVIGRMPRELPPPGVALSPHHRLLERLAGSPAPLHPWTVNSRTRIRETADMRVASITTNRPDLAVAVLHG